jgi:hypothetical protein
MEDMEEDARKQSARKEYEREVQRDIRHSIPESEWCNEMHSQERHDNEINDIARARSEQGKAPLPDYPLHISTSYHHYAFSDPSTFKVGQQAMFYSSGIMHHITVQSSTPKDGDSEHTFTLAGRTITTTLPLYKIETTHHSTPPIDPFKPTAPDYQDQHGWNDYEDFINNGMLTTPPERRSPIMYIHHTGEHINLLPARFIKQRDNHTCAIRTMENKLIFDYAMDIYPHVQRFENRADTPYDNTLIDLSAHRYKGDAKVLIPRVGEQYVHDDWYTTDRMQIVTVTSVSPNGITFTRPGPISTHTSTGPFYKPQPKFFHQFDLNPTTYDTPILHPNIADIVLVKQPHTMAVAINCGEYNNGFYVGTRKEPTGWITPPLYAPLQRQYSTHDIGTTELRGLKYYDDDEHGLIIRDHEIYSKYAGDDLKPGQAAMILDPQQNIMIPILITNKCETGYTFLDEFNEEHFSTDDVYYPITVNMHAIVNHRSEYNTNDINTTPRNIGEYISYDAGSQFLLQATITNARHPEYDITTDGTNEHLTVNAQQLFTPIRIKMSELIRNKSKYQNLAIIGTYITTSDEDGSKNIAPRSLENTIRPTTPKKSDNDKDPFSTEKKKMTRDIDNFTNDIEAIHNRNNLSTPSSDSSDTTDYILPNPFDPSPPRTTKLANTPESWEHLSGSPLAIKPRRSAASLSKAPYIPKRTIWDTPASTASTTSSSSSDGNNYHTSPTTIKRARDRIRGTTSATATFSSSDSSSAIAHPSPRKRLFQSKLTLPPRSTTTPSLPTNQRKPVSASPIRAKINKISDRLRSSKKCYKLGST